MVIAALEAGKHVLCEKPMARNLAEARDMQRIAERVGTVSMVNNQLRFLPVRMRIRELISEGYIGEPHAASVVVHRSSLNDPHERPWGWLMEQEKAGGMLGATGAHYLDALRWWFGEVKAVAGAVSTMVRQRRLPDSSAMAKVDADDNFSVILRFANGALGTIHVSATAGHEGDEECHPFRVRRHLTSAPGTPLGCPQRRVQPHRATVPEHLSGGVIPGGHYLVQPTALLLRAWANAIGAPPASPSFADKMKPQELIDGALAIEPAGSLDRHQRRTLADDGIIIMMPERSSLSALRPRLRLKPNTNIVAGEQALDTPLIAVDLDLLERNIAEMASLAATTAYRCDLMPRRTRVRILPACNSRQAPSA